MTLIPVSPTRLILGSGKALFPSRKPPLIALGLSRSLPSAYITDISAHFQVVWSQTFCTYVLPVQLLIFRNRDNISLILWFLHQPRSCHVVEPNKCLINGWLSDQMEMKDIPSGWTNRGNYLQAGSPRYVKRGNRG